MAQSKKNVLMNLVGMRFGKLVVLERVERVKGDRGHVKWRCRCDCGKETVALATNLRRGLTRSCGCAQYHRAPSMEKGARFGKLVILERAEGPRGRGFHPRWRCRCDCGNEMVVYGNKLRRGHTKSCGCAHWPRTSLLEKIQRNVRIAENGCWIWGTGKWKWYRNTKDKGKKVSVHRAVYEQFKGPIPDGLFVCHNCPGGDNPACCNPDHLWLGTNAENLQDASRKRRLKERGEAK